MIVQNLSITICWPIVCGFLWFVIISENVVDVNAFQISLIKDQRNQLSTRMKTQCNILGNDLTKTNFYNGYTELRMASTLDKTSETTKAKDEEKLPDPSNIKKKSDTTKVPTYNDDLNLKRNQVGTKSSSPKAPSFRDRVTSSSLVSASAVAIAAGTYQNNYKINKKTEME